MLFGRKKKDEYLAFMAGKLISLEKVKDPVFSTKVLGDGFAIEPTQEEVVAPCDGEVITVFPTGHAYGLKTKNGREILIHLGIDTVELKGQGFESFISEGQQVKSGELLGKMDLKTIQQAGRGMTSMLIFTSGEQIKLLKENQMVKLGEERVIKLS